MSCGILHSSFQNQTLGVKNIASFFGISLTGEELRSVIERSSFQSMKENSLKTHGALGSMLFRKGRELLEVQRQKHDALKDLSHSSLAHFLHIYYKVLHISIKHIITALLEKTSKGALVRNHRIIKVGKDL